MNFRPGNTILALLAFMVLSAGAQSGKKPKIKRQVIEAVEGLRYSPARISMKQGEQLQLKFVNRDPNDQPHNLVIIKPGSLTAIQAASLEIGPDSIKNQYVPEHKAVLAASSLLESDKSGTLTFEPEAKGIYHYVCTFPGHAAVMYGAIYVNQRPPRDLASDPNIPKMVRDLEREKIKKALEVERPAVTRAFLPDAGPAAIAVALPGKLNYCWDAGNCRLRYAWSGAFIDRRAMLNSNGSKLTSVLETPFWSAGGGESDYSLQTVDPKARPDFKGYRLVNGVPEFRYLIGDLEIRESITPFEGGLKWQFQIKGTSGPVRIFSPGAVESDQGKRDGDYWVFDPNASGTYTLKIKSPK